MRFYPRNAQARRDALAGSGHIGNHSMSDQGAERDRLIRRDPAIDLSKVAKVYGGTKDPIG